MYKTLTNRLFKESRTLDNNHQERQSSLAYSDHPQGTWSLKNHTTLKRRTSPLQGKHY